jgi:glycosyltransferase involved in cell wall biosynthesis
MSPELGTLPVKVGRSTFIYHGLPLDELIALYHSHHVFVYPSWGEGFGLQPLQALATGMPTIVTSSWAPYSRYLPWRWRLNSTLVDSPWPQSHPGQMFKPNRDALVESMRYFVDNYEDQSRIATSISPEIRKQFDWLRLTEECFKSLEERLQK